jgi:hypothetical protein
VWHSVSRASQPAARVAALVMRTATLALASAASEEPNDDNHDHDDDHDDENRLEHVSAFLSETVAPICTQRHFGALPRAYVDRFGRGVFGCSAQNAHQNRRRSPRAASVSVYGQPVRGTKRLDMAVSHRVPCFVVCRAVRCFPSEVLGG